MTVMYIIKIKAFCKNSTGKSNRDSVVRVYII